MLDSPLFSRVLPDGRTADVIPLTYGRARIVVGKEPERFGYDDAW